VNRDEVRGKAQAVKGKVKKAIGNAVHDGQWRDEGAVEEAAGRTQETVGRARRKIGEAIKSVGKAIKK
jgi:uncharacterized protein YjbJ (UPF0337 family)